jgi:hypothetical protein
MAFGGQEKVHETLSQPIDRHGARGLSFQATLEAEIRRIVVPGQPRLVWAKNKTLSSK